MINLLSIVECRLLGYVLLAAVIIVIVLFVQPEPVVGATCGALLLTAAEAVRLATRRDLPARGVQLHRM